MCFGYMEMTKHIFLSANYIVKTRQLVEYNKNDIRKISKTIMRWHSNPKMQSQIIKILKPIEKDAENVG